MRLLGGGDRVGAQGKVVEDGVELGQEPLVGVQMCARLPVERGQHGMPGGIVPGEPVDPGGSALIEAVDDGFQRCRDLLCRVGDALMPGGLCGDQGVELVGSGGGRAAVVQSAFPVGDPGVDGGVHVQRVHRGTQRRGLISAYIDRTAERPRLPTEMGPGPPATDARRPRRRI